MFVVGVVWGLSRWRALAGEVVTRCFSFWFVWECRNGIVMKEEEEKKKWGEILKREEIDNRAKKKTQKPWLFNVVDKETLRDSDRKVWG